MPTTDEKEAPGDPSPTPESVSRSTTLREKRRLPVWIPTFIGRGIVRDIRARAPYYVSDWIDAWNYRVIPAIVLIFFAK